MTRFAILRTALLLAAGALFVPLMPTSAQDKDKDQAKDKEPARGSLVEDRAAHKLLEAGDARLDAGETVKAVEVWQSVLERYPRSRVRYEAHLRLGNHLLERDRAFDRARTHFEAAAAEGNPDENMRALAMLRAGVCFYEARNYGKSFKVMRDLIERFPVSPHVNQAYYYVGLGHFQLGHYSRAISSLEKVGTVLAGEEGKVERVEAGKRLFIKIEDADLAALEPGKTVKVAVVTTQGDKEIVECYPIGRNVRVVLGSILTILGKPQPGDGKLQVRGDDKVKVTYIDAHTADRKFDRPVHRVVSVFGNGIVEVTDGAFRETLQGVVLGKAIHLQITDADRDLTDAADSVKAVAEIWREKTQKELETETVDAPKEGAKTERYRLIDKVEVTLTETRVQREITLPGEIGDEPRDTPAKPAEAAKKEEDNVVHTGVFRTTVQLARADTPVADDNILQALPGDQLRIRYIDEINGGPGPRTVVTMVRCLEGNLGGVRVTQAQITDQELRIRTQLKTASALTNIGNRYKEFGLKDNADARYQQALKVCETIGEEARRLGGRVLEETYVQLWKIYFEMDKLELAAAMSQRLQQEFPNSEFVDAALLQLAQVARKQNQLQRAVGIYTSLLAMEKSSLRGEAQFGIAECYEEMARNTEGANAAQLYDRSFQEYKAVYDRFPDSGRVGEAVAKMANYYYQQKDYKRAIDTFEGVLSAQPDAKFLDVILFNYARCLFRLERKAEARKQFEQLLADFPESPLAPDAKRIAEALRKQGS
jgi:tetratricopeptide (TPR) repeat protein